MASPNLLVELLVEELPPKALKRLGQAFADTLAAGLKAQGLAPIDAKATPYATPRRLAAHITSVAARAQDRSLRQKLMPVSVGLDADGRPTPALLKRLAALGADPAAAAGLQRVLDGKAEALFLDSRVPGVTLAEGLQKALDETLAQLPIPKLMSYQLDRGVGADFQPGWTTVQFVRPAHRLVALHGAEVVDVGALGLMAGRITCGHRFEAATSPLALRDADGYAAQMQAEGAVLASFDERRAEIARQLCAAATAQGLRPIEDDALLDEVTALVEWPNVLVCRFEPEFLALPPECLILTMKANQRYFPLLDADGRLTERFLVVSNIRPADPSAVVQGNERVVRPRLADARFFFEQDCKKPLASRVDALAQVVYHARLGTMRERVERVRAIARALGGQLGGDALAQRCDEAARLAKADLLTDMVGEFPELQGLMGRYYAQHDGLDDEIAYAIEDHYKPRFAGDQLPRNTTGIALALADKLETLAGLFGIGQLPTGDKDPFALRRHALGVVRMLVERELPLDLDQIVALATQQFGALIADQPATARKMIEFIIDRLGAGLREQGYSAQEVDAVLSRGDTRLSDVRKRVEAVREFGALPEASSLAAANKRVKNILGKSERAARAEVDADAFVETAERDLHRTLHSIGRRADAAFDAGDYAESLRSLAALKAPVDAFFDAVLVNADDPALRSNRLALLATLHSAMNRVADLSKLAS